MDRCFPTLALAACGWLVVLAISQDHGPPAAGAAQNGEFATGNKSGPEPVKVDAKRMMGYLESICDLGPRISGSAGMEKQQDLIRNHFTKLGADVQTQKFTGKQVSQAEAVSMANLVVSWHPKAKDRIILCSHYDTRPIADQEKNPKNWKKPFISANDGGSGVALMMELGHHIKGLKLNVGVDFVFFDGEEYIFKSNIDEYFFGSKHFAKTWKNNGKQPNYQAAVLLDMIGGKNPSFPIEGNSYLRAKDLSLEIWKIAAKQGCESFQNKLGPTVLDDHVALLNAGIRAIDIIDFSYPHWHKLSDTPESCAPDGMEQVARTLTVWMQTLK